jgi:glycosyltransferase involved in cell wall biosynthesis
MRIGLITYGLDRPLSGIGRYTLELARGLAKLLAPGDLFLLGPAPAGPWRRVTLPGSERLPSLLLQSNLALPGLVKRLGLDLLHDPTGCAPFGLGQTSAPRVVTVHDTFPWSCPGTSTRLEVLLHRYWLPWALRHTEQIITDSQTSARDIVRYLGPPTEKVQVIPLAVGPLYRPPGEAAVQAVRARYGLPERYILFAGGLNPRKNLLRLLKACRLVWRTGEQRPLVVLGASDEALQPVLAPFSMEQRVHGLGYVPEDDLPGIYGGADLFCYPSLYEGFGLPALEAMACGAPVLCSNNAALPEVVGTAAILVDPYDIEALANAISAALHDTNGRHELRSRGIKQAHHFSWERTAQTTLEVYHATIASSTNATNAHPAKANQRLHSDRL